MYTVPAHINKLIHDIELIAPDDENIEALEKAMEFYCSTWDICEGFKFAIIQCLQDQYTNHEAFDPQEEDIKELKEILDIK